MLWVDEQVENNFSLLAIEMAKDIRKEHARQIFLSVEFSMWLIRNSLMNKYDKFWWFQDIPTWNQPFKPFTYALIR